MKMPHATAKPVSVVRNLLRLAVLHISSRMSYMALRVLAYFILPWMPKGDASWSKFSSISPI